MTSENDRLLAYGASSLAIYANLVIQVAVMVALFYAASQFEGGEAAVFYFLATTTAIGIFVTAVVKVFVDVAMSMLRKKSALDKAKQR